MRNLILRELRCRKVQAYLAVGTGLCLGYWTVRGSTWQSSSQFHTILEVIATMLALMVGVIALVRYHSVKDNTILFIGTGFFGTALLDGFHAIVTSSYFKPMMPTDLPHLIPWSWIASRLFLSVLLWLSWVAWRRAVRPGKAGEVSARGVYITVAALTLTSFVLFIFAPLPRAYYPEFVFHRPEEFVPAFFFLLAFIGYLRKGAWRSDPLEHWLVLSLIVGFLGQAAFMSFSGRLFDLEFDLAHNLKSVSYVFVLAGLMLSMFVKFREVEADVDVVARANASMKREINIREQAEADLLRAEEQTRMTLVALVDAVLTIDMKGSITWINPACVATFGYEPDELVGRNIKMLMTEEDSEHHDGYLRGYAKTGIATIIGQGREVVGRRKDGSIFPLDLAVSELRTPGRPGYTGILRDITERKQAERKLARANEAMMDEIKVREQAEAALLRAEERTRMILTTLVDAVLTIDKKGTITSINPAGVAMFGYEPLDLIDCNIKMLMTKDDKEHHDGYLSTYQITGKATIIGKGREVVGRRKDGSTFPLDLAVSEIQSAGAPGYTGILRDISQRKQADEALALAQSRLVEAIESIPDGFAIYDREDRLIMANQQLKNVHPGMAELYAVGRTYEEIIRDGAGRGLVPDSIGREEDWVLERLSQHRGEVVRAPEAKSAKGRWIKATDRPTKEGGTVSLRTDVTELKRREMELKRSNDELERFAYVASHDLQEPLRNIQAFGDRLARKYREAIPEEGRDYINRMLDASARMRTLISDLLDFARVTSSDKPFEQVDLNLIIQAVVGDIEIRLTETGARVDIGELPSIPADPSQMRQLFQNLIGNALKFQRPDAAPVIKVQSANPTGMSGECEIVVEDNGIGFDEKHGARIFEMFQRLHSRTEYAGTGVGLAICRRIVQRHRGSIEASGRPGEGATFRICLPQQQESEESVDEAA